MLTIFDGNDAHYQRWLSQHDAGFVVNARRRPSPSYLVLHRARCSTIARYAKHAPAGAFTERGYIKLCADEVEELLAWIAQRWPGATFSKRCSLCGA